MTINIDNKTWIRDPAQVAGGRFYSDVDKVPSAGGGALVWSQNFETDMSGVTNPNPDGSSVWQVARVTSNPYSGTHSLRGNLKAGTTDPITGLLSANGYTANIIPPSLRSLTPNICVHRYKFRLDDASWLTSTGADAELKMGYWSDTSASDVTQDAFWPVLNFGAGKVAYIGRNSTWLNTEIGAEWGASNVYLQSHAGNVGPGTGWHTFEIHFDYVNQVFRMYIDGELLKGSSRFTDGDFYLGPTFMLDAWRVWYSGNSLSMSTDGTEYACGWQVDDVEFFDEVP